jgi:hypothetical protein
MAGAALGALGGGTGGGAGISPSSSATSGAGDVNAGFLNNAGLTVGGSGRTSASADSGIPSAVGGSNLPVYIALGVLGIVGIVLAFRR